MFQMLMNVHWVQTPVTRCVIIVKGITRVVATRATPLMQTVANVMVGIQPPLMTSSNGNVFRVTDPVTRSFDVLFDLRLE